MAYWQSGQWASKIDWQDAYDQSRTQHDEILRQLEAGEITTADAANAIKSLGVWRTRPSTDPILRQKYPDLKELYDPITGMKITDWQVMAPGKEPNPDDAPYRPRPPGGKPWPGYPKPMPPGGPPAKLAHGDPSTHQHTIGEPNSVYFNTPVKEGGYNWEHPSLAPSPYWHRRDKEMWKKASHDNPQFKSVPATGVRGDQPAGEIKDFLNRKDENLLQTQDRLKRV